MTHVTFDPAGSGFAVGDATHESQVAEFTDSPDRFLSTASTETDPRLAGLPGSTRSASVRRGGVDV